MKTTSRLSSKPSSNVCKLVNRGYALHLQIAKLTEEFKTIKEQLKLEALDHPLDRVPLVHTAADGEAWIGKGEGCECRIIFPAPRLLNVVDETHANYAAIRSITRKHFPELFQKLTIYELIDRTHFRENVAKKFGDLQSNQLLSLCSVPSEPKATWKNSLTDEKKNVRGAHHE
jgi:hypothetical protein